MQEIPAVLLPPACFPDAEFFAWLLHAPQVSIEMQESYPKQTCRNRYRIATAQGITVLSVPVNKPQGNNSPFKIIELDNSTTWNITHWRTIESAYSKSPFFIYYRDHFEQLFLNPPALLKDLNISILNLCLKLIGLKKEFDYTQTFENKPVNYYDMRGLIMPKKQVQHGYQIKTFKPYIQVFSDRNEFLENLSILDLLFNLGPETIVYLQNHKPGQSTPVA